MDWRVLVVLLWLGGSGLWAQQVAEPSGDVRLARGSRRCAGRLEVKGRGVWEPVLGNSHGDVWNLTSAAAACRRLNCGAVESLRRDRIEPDSDSAPSILKDFGYLDSILDESFTIEITCSGRLEVKLGQSWSPVSEKGFDQREAEVVCRQINCGAPSVQQGELFGETETPQWSAEFECGGGESALLDCGQTVTNSSGAAVELTCSDDDRLRLAGGGGRCAGILEMRHWDEWKPAFTDHWMLEFAVEVCRQLDCGTAVSTRKRTNAHRYVWKLDPEGDQPDILNFPIKLSFSSFSTEVNCSDSVRLVNGADRCSGRLEVRSEQSWSSVCAKDFDRRDAEVVCREVGCGPPLALEGAPYGEVGAPMGATEFHCEGQESGLRDYSVRLVNGADRCSGRLEVKSEQSWSSVCAKDFDRRDAEVVCREVGCGPPLALEGAPYGEVGAPMGATEFHCEGQESGLRDCRRSAPFRSSCPVGEAAALTCSDGLRLGGGTSRCQGVLEMENRGQWRPVADLDFVWDQNWTATVCGRLGCGVAVVTVVTDDADVRPVWWVKGGCVRPDAGLRECLTGFQAGFYDPGNK
ncbi:unnamed protein product [Menidia menidia]|uniref:(Atlantic silverside) hypothetical protein n=1 Tax=Menidia menidia TaxID=238744 RepID=A0A8S4BMB1_9TELE|nr:unnamed protein product [Menidia menidia]